ncbi:MAG TPA: hypothetical protein PKK43_10595, partial [Spirochaetota bacterium]|nr:hypothetical protein [Spirochaetota bacterium]
MKAVIRLTIAAVILAAAAGSVPVRAAEVKAVYFYSASCSQCRYVSEKVIPPLKDKYGDRLVIDAREVSSEKNLRLLLDMERNAG